MVAELREVCGNIYIGVGAPSLVYPGSTVQLVGAGTSGRLKHTAALSGMNRSPMTNTRREVILMRCPQLNVPFLNYTDRMVDKDWLFAG